MALVVQPAIVEFPCLQCLKLIRLVGGRPAACCGQEYALALTVRQTDQKASEAFQAELKQCIAHAERDEPFKMPPTPQGREWGIDT